MKDIDILLNVDPQGTFGYMRLANWAGAENIAGFLAAVMIASLHFVFEVPIMTVVAGGLIARATIYIFQRSTQRSRLRSR